MALSNGLPLQVVPFFPHEAGRRQTARRYRPHRRFQGAPLFAQSWNVERRESDGGSELAGAPLQTVENLVDVFEARVSVQQTFVFETRRDLVHELAAGAGDI